MKKVLKYGKTLLALGLFCIQMTAPDLRFCVLSGEPIATVEVTSELYDDVRRYSKLGHFPSYMTKKLQKACPEGNLYRFIPVKPDPGARVLEDDPVDINVVRQNVQEFIIAFQNQPRLLLEVDTMLAEQILQSPSGNLPNAVGYAIENFLDKEIIECDLSYLPEYGGYINIKYNLDGLSQDRKYLAADPDVQSQVHLKQIICWNNYTSFIQIQLGHYILLLPKPEESLKPFIQELETAKIPQRYIDPLIYMDDLKFALNQIPADLSIANFREEYKNGINKYISASLEGFDGAVEIYRYNGAGRVDRSQPPVTHTITPSTRIPLAEFIKMMMEQPIKLQWQPRD